MLLSEAKTQAMQHIREYMNSGTVISTTDGNYKDLLSSMNIDANTAQMELCKISKIPKTHIINQNVIPNLLGLSAANEVQHYPGTDLSYSFVGAKSFSVEVGKFACTIYFYETIAGVLTPLNGTYSLDGATPVVFTGSIAVTGTDNYVNYKGLLTTSSALNTVTMKIVATYPMKSRYRALFAYSFPTADVVPHYMAYVPYTLPSNYMEFEKMMRESDERLYKENVDYVLTNDNKIHINWNLPGQFIVHYWAWPTEITTTTADTYPFEVGTDACSIIPYYMASKAVIDDKKALSVMLLNIYEDRKLGLNKPKTNTSDSIQNSMWTVKTTMTLEA
jgi:hypothetical protein